MKNEKFNQAIDEIVGFIVDVNKLQMDQLKNNIKTVHEANTGTLDVNTIAQQILDTPINSKRRIACIGSGMVYTVEEKTPYGEPGDLEALSYVKVGNGAPYGKEFYHHCPMHSNDLIRLHYVKQDNVHACPVCKLVFRQF